MTEYEMKREQIARIRCLHCEEYSHHKQSCLITPNVTPFCPEALAIADEFLSLDGIEIRADDQTTPDIEPPKQQSIIGEVNVFTQSFIRKRTAYLEGEMDMLKAGFVKVAPKPNV